MRLLIEIENEQEKILVKDKIDKVEKIFKQNVEIIYSNGAKDEVDVLDQIEHLQWEMGKKLFKERDQLYER